MERAWLQVVRGVEHAWKPRGPRRCERTADGDLDCHTKVHVTPSQQRRSSAATAHVASGGSRRQSEAWALRAWCGLLTARRDELDRFALRGVELE